MTWILRDRSVSSFVIPGSLFIYEKGAEYKSGEIIFIFNSGNIKYFQWKV